MSKPRHRKPSGMTGPIRFGQGKIVREFVTFPDSKEELELQVAQAFCDGSGGMKEHLARYTEFTGLTQQKENSIDFSVQTPLGQRWLELAEFAPLENFSGRYQNIPQTWNTETMLACLLDLISAKNDKNYGDNVILVIYKTHETCLIPAPVLRLARPRLVSFSSLNFESIYYLSPLTVKDANVWEVWPGKDGDFIPGDTVHVGFGLG